MDQYAEFSCVSCRRLKRKCSKDLPTCSLCSRVGRTCLYQSPTSNPDSSYNISSDQSSSQHINGDVVAPGNIATPPVIAGFKPLPLSSRSPLVHSFLDSISMRGEEPALANGLQWQQLHRDAEPMPLKAAWAVADRFFETTYDWLPIGEWKTSTTT